MKTRSDLLESIHNIGVAILMNNYSGGDFTLKLPRDIYERIRFDLANKARYEQDPLTTELKIATPAGWCVVEPIE